MTARVLPALLLAVCCGGCLGGSYRRNPRVAIVDGDPIVQMAKPGRMRSIAKPRLVPSDRRFDVPDPDSPVLGFALPGSPRAYPIGLLDRYEVVNDSAGDLAFVLARCALTGIAAAYDRRVAGRELRFENSGALWRDTLVLRDRETGTYWSAANGRALFGPLNGETLARVPAAFTRLKDWERAFPDSLYMDEWTATSVPVVVQIYGLSPWLGVSGQKSADPRYRAKQQVFVVAEGEQALAFSVEEVERRGRLDATIGGGPIQISWDARLRAPRAEIAGARDSIAVVPMYWFAVGRHFPLVRTVRD